MLHQTLLQQGIVLNDAVMDYCQLLRLRKMGMRIHLVRFPVGCPAGVRNADMAADILVLGKFLQFGDLTLRLIDVKLSVRIYQRHAGTVIASVFQTMKPFNQNRIGILITDISYYSAHDTCFLIIVSLFRHVTCGTEKKCKNNQKIN